MDTRDMIDLVKEISGEHDVAFVQIPHAEVKHDEEILHARRVLRLGRRYLVEVVEYPGEWWMGELSGDTLLVWGSYGSLDQAAAQD
jgi:hypothetical protein